MKIGILGGGQLSRMLALAGIPLGFKFIFYEPNNAEAVEGLGTIMHAPYTCTNSLAEFAKLADFITYENESIPYSSVEFIEKIKPTHPNSKALRFSQDRLNEKNLFKQLNINVNHFQKVDCKMEAMSFGQTFKYPFILKKRTLGYDGKGQYVINNENDLLILDDNIFHNMIAEEIVHFDREISIIAISKGPHHIVYYDLCENQHQSGILIKTYNKPLDPAFEIAKDYIDRIIAFLNYTGCIAFEFFQVGNNLFANETAPRVHNSGHWTIEGAATSQFENHLRAICDLPLGSTKSLGHSCMVNIIGEMPDKQLILNNKNAYLHDYGKTPYKGRKLGHITHFPIQKPIAEPI